MTTSAATPGSEHVALFTDDYRLARELFMAAARAAGAQLETLPSARLGPRGEALAIDVATLGESSAPSVLLVSAGVHGVEAAIGSAVQRGWLAVQPSIPQGLRVVLLHAVNPWGFAHGRRTDAGNVDLNRNFLLPGEPFAGTPPGLAELMSVFTPRSPKPRVEGFGLRAAALLLARGHHALHLMLTGGQHEHRQGLFYGGREHAESTRLLQARYPAWLGEARHALHLDLHSGLGRNGSTLALAQCEPDSEDERTLRELFRGSQFRAEGVARRQATEWRGVMGRWLALGPGANCERFVFCTVEFGTVGPIAAFGALREENRAWWQTSSRRAAATRRLRAAFAPAATGWRHDAQRRGVMLLNRAVAAWSAPPPD